MQESQGGREWCGGKRSKFQVLTAMLAFPSMARTCPCMEAAQSIWQFWLQQHLGAPQFPLWLPSSAPASPEELREEGQGPCPCLMKRPGLVPFRKAHTLEAAQGVVDLAQVKPFRVWPSVSACRAPLVVKPKALLKSLKWNCLKMASNLPARSTLLPAGLAAAGPSPQHLACVLCQPCWVVRMWLSSRWQWSGPAWRWVHWGGTF